MTNRTKALKTRPEEKIGWIWEDDDIAAAPCDSRQLDVNDQSPELHHLGVYEGLMTCKVDTDRNEPAVITEEMDNSLANILAFADDCRAASEWLTEESVSFEDEKGRRFGQRRRHLKERGFLKDGRPFVRICGRIVDTNLVIAAMAARHCIDEWKESRGVKTLHFQKCEDGMRWEPCGHRSNWSTRMIVSNPFTAPATAPEADGREVLRYELSAIDDDGITAERQTSTEAETKNPEDDAAYEHPGWMLNKRARKTAKWLFEAAETVADAARIVDEHSLRTIFPSLQDMRRLKEYGERPDQGAPSAEEHPEAQDESVD